jgi:hypothetical protein
MEYSAARTRRYKAAQKRAQDAKPTGGPITITHADGTVEVRPPDNAKTDRPYRGRKR